MMLSNRAPLLAAFFVFATILPAAAAPLVLPRDAIVRKGPGEQYEHVWDWVAGTRVDVRECKTTNWCYAFRLGKRGWIKLDDPGTGEDTASAADGDGGGTPGKPSGGTRGRPSGGNNFEAADDDVAEYPTNAQLLGGGVIGGGSGGTFGGGSAGASAATEVAPAPSCQRCAP
jgi:hypothetical protein